MKQDFRSSEKFSPYEVNSDGIVRNLKTGEYVDCKIGTHGYYYKSYYLVHRMVAELFIPNPEGKRCVNHKNSIRTDNRVCNLEWATHSENTKHMVSQGRQSINGKRGEENHLTFLSDETIHNICKDLCDGLRNVDVANKYGISQGYVKHLKANKSRRDITSQYNFTFKSRKSISESTVRWICEQILKGVRSVDIVKMSNNPKVTKILLKNIKSKRVYRSITSEYF